VPGETDELLARIERLEAELSELRADARRATHHESSTDDSDEVPVTTTRRRAVGMLAAGAVGALAVGMDGQSAAAADGDPVRLGFVNPSTSPTVVDAALANYTNDANFVAAALTMKTSGKGYGFSSDGSWGNALFVATGSAPAPSHARQAGILWVDGGGNWWASVGANQWRQIAGPSYSAGPSLHMLPMPVRVYDSRPDQDPLDVQPKVPLSDNEPRDIDLTARNSGVPTNAVAAMISYSIIGPTGPGFTAAWAGGDWPGVSQINYQAGQTFGTSMIIGVTNGKIRIKSLRGGDVLVDVYAYFA
jgi:hypothetical protein